MRIIKLVIKGDVLGDLSSHNSNKVQANVASMYLTEYVLFFQSYEATIVSKHYFHPHDKYYFIFSIIFLSFLQITP